MFRSTIRAIIRPTVKPAFSNENPGGPWINVGNGQYLDIGDGRRLGI